MKTTTTKKHKKKNASLHYRIRMSLLLFLLFNSMIVALILDHKNEEARKKRAEASSAGDTSSFDYMEAVQGMTLYDKDEHKITKERADELLEDYASCYGYDVSAYPDRERALLSKHFEAREFVLNYPIKMGIATATDAEPYKPTDPYDKSDIDIESGVPHLYQWDTRWAYTKYGSDAMGITGCGPTALSMVAMYLLQDKKYTPDYMARFSEREGYSIPGSGTSWELMSEGATKLGLKSNTIALDENKMAEELLAGRPLICIMAPGTFTDVGHFIVITGYQGSKKDGFYSGGFFTVNDPNCTFHSMQKWKFSDIVNETGNVWSFEVREKD